MDAAPDVVRKSLESAIKGKQRGIDRLTTQIEEYQEAEMRADRELEKLQREQVELQKALDAAGGPLGKKSKGKKKGKGEK